MAQPSGGSTTNPSTNGSGDGDTADSYFRIVEERCSFLAHRPAVDLSRIKNVCNHYWNRLTVLDTNVPPPDIWIVLNRPPCNCCVDPSTSRCMYNSPVLSRAPSSKRIFFIYTSLTELTNIEMRCFYEINQFLFYSFAPKHVLFFNTPRFVYETYRSITGKQTSTSYHTQLQTLQFRLNKLLATPSTLGEEKQQQQHHQPPRRVEGGTSSCAAFFSRPADATEVQRQGVQTGPP